MRLLEEFIIFAVSAGVTLGLLLWLVWRYCDPYIAAWFGQDWLLRMLGD